MKKNRPGTLLCCLCRPEDQERLARCLFAATETLGIRSQLMDRFVLERRTQTLETPWGPVRCKTAEGYGTRREKYEYDDLAKIAQRESITLREAEKRIDRWRKDRNNG